MPPSEWDPEEADATFQVDEAPRAVHERIRDREWTKRDEAREQKEAAIASEEPVRRARILELHNVIRKLPPTPTTPDAELTREQHRSRRHRAVRATTVSMKRMTKRELAIGAALYPEQPGTDYQRPKTRGECAGGVRPCPFVSCQHNLYLDVSDQTGAIKLNFPDLEPHEMAESCALDVADRGGITLEDVGRLTNVTRERVRQIELLAYRDARAGAAPLAADLGIDIAGHPTTEDGDVVAPSDAPEKPLPKGVSADALRRVLEAMPNGARMTGLDTLTDQKLLRLVPEQFDAVVMRYLSGPDTSIGAMAERLHIPLSLARGRDARAFKELGIQRPAGLLAGTKLPRRRPMEAATPMAAVTPPAAPPTSAARPSHPWRQFVLSPPSAPPVPMPVAPSLTKMVAAPWTPGGFKLPAAPVRRFEPTE